ncbi:hypothetical protein ACFXTH_031857 [Malus domestica]
MIFRDFEKLERKGKMMEKRASMPVDVNGSSKASGAASMGITEMQYQKAKTSVWFPRSAMPKVSISTYDDTHGIPASVQQALSSSGIALNHVPAGVKDASDKKILVDMLFWAVDKPAPANYLLISGDRDFSNALVWDKI